MKCIVPYAKYLGKCTKYFTLKQPQNCFNLLKCNGLPQYEETLITSGSTASASELTINGLEPYVDVVQVGTKTVGKNEFSLTMVDDPGSPLGAYIYMESREGFINPNNQWAIQPLYGRNENADGFSDFTAGLSPDYELKEDVGNLGTLGDSSEPLLALTLNAIEGGNSKFSFEPIFPVELVSPPQS